METQDYIEGLLVVGGDLSLDFVNTVDGEPAFDHLQSYEGLVAWGQHVGVVSEEDVHRLLREAKERPSDAEAAHARALELRGVIYETFSAIARGERPSSENLEALRREECKVLARASLVPVQDSFAWEWSGETDAGSLLGPVVHAAVELLTRGRLDRVKACAACHWLFLDLSKNKSRRWCSMEVCGTNEKIRRYVSRRAAGRRAK